MFSRIVTVSIICFSILAAVVSPGRTDMVGHGGMVRALAVSPNGQYVLTSSFDYSAKLWSFDE